MYWTQAKMTPDGAVWKEEFESDQRDYRLDQVLKMPTPAEVKKIPMEYSLVEALTKTYLQSPYQSCTAVALTHLHLIQNILDFNSSDIAMSWEDLRVNMWHSLKETGWEWDYLENALKTLLSKWIKWIDPDWNDKTFWALSYAFQWVWNLDFMKHFISNGHPLYLAFRWNAKVYREMKIWHLSTTITRQEATWWHAVIVTGYDEEFLYFTNSWHPKGSKLSWFKMSHIDFESAIAKSMVTWRYWVVYDKVNDEKKLFLDYNPDIWSEEYDAVKFMKDKWYMKWYKWKLMPNKNLTREEFCIVMYRILEDKKVTSKTVTSEATSESDKKKKPTSKSSKKTKK